MSKKLAIISFTGHGSELGNRLAAELSAEHSRCPQNTSLAAWTAENFHKQEALIFIGATGIAIRAVAPYLVSKTEDPAIIAIDTLGQYVIPLCSGHLGGANALARKIAKLLDALPIITTASDSLGLFPVDEWTRVQSLVIKNPEQIKVVSAKILRGQPVNYHSEVEISGKPPQGLVNEPDKRADFAVDYHEKLTGLRARSLHILPTNLYLGVGCRRGTILAAIVELFEELNIDPRSIAGIASIELKADEAGLLEFAEKYGFKKYFYAAEELAVQPGEFYESAFVKQTTGVGSVAERAAVAAAKGGKLILKRQVKAGVTMALASAKDNIDWRYEDE